MSMAAGGGWVRPLNSVEVFMGAAGAVGTMTTVQGALLAHRGPLTGATLRAALRRWRRETPLLNVCVRRWGITQYFHWLDPDYEMDFDMGQESVDHLEVMEEMTNTTFNMSEGPLWKVRYVKLKSDSKSSTEASCQSVLVLAVAHVIVDAFTNYVLMADLVRAINFVLLNGDTNESPDNTDWNFPPDLSDRYMKSSLLDQMKIGMRETYGMIPCLVSMRNCPSANLLRITKLMKEKVISYNIQKTISEKTTRKLLKLCKEKDTTMHLCVATAANVAMKRVLLPEMQVDVDSFSARNVDCVNLRRYFDERDRNTLGCLVSYQTCSVQMHEYDIENFWEIAQRERKILHNHIKKGSPLELFPLLSSNGTTMYIQKLFEILGLKCLIDSLMVTTNMGDISGHFEDNLREDVPVKVLDTFRSGSGELGGSFMVLIFHSFRGELQISLDSSTNKMTRELVEDVLEETVNVLLEVACG